MGDFETDTNSSIDQEKFYAELHQPSADGTATAETNGAGGGSHDEGAGPMEEGEGSEMFSANQNRHLASSPAPSTSSSGQGSIAATSQRSTSPPVASPRMFESHPRPAQRTAAFTSTTADPGSSSSSSSAGRPTPEPRPLQKADTLDMGDLPQRVERRQEATLSSTATTNAAGPFDRDTDKWRRGDGVSTEADGEDSLDSQGSPRPRPSPSLQQQQQPLSPSHKLGFTYNRDADLIRKKRASLRHSESDTTSDSSSPPPPQHQNHTDSTPPPTTRPTQVRYRCAFYS